MINAGIAGLGWWGQTLVEAVSGGSDKIRFVAGATRTVNADVKSFAGEHGFALKESYEDLLADPNVDAVVLATPHSMHVEQVVAAAAQGKHVFCEKPFALTRAGAERAVEATDRAGVTLGLGYNRRWHPEMVALRERIASGDLGVVLHVEATMTFPNALYLKSDAWRANREETPCGGLTPMGVHAVDGMIDLCGEVEEVYCQSFRRVVEVDAKGALVELGEGVEGYLRTSEIARDRIDDVRSVLKVGDEVEAKFVGVDRKKRIPSLSIKAKESDEEAQALQEYTTSAPTGATTLGDLIKEQMSSGRREGVRED